MWNKEVGGPNLGSAICDIIYEVRIVNWEPELRRGLRNVQQSEPNLLLYISQGLLLLIPDVNEIKGLVSDYIEWWAVKWILLPNKD